MTSFSSFLKLFCWHLILYYQCIFWQQTTHTISVLHVRDFKFFWPNRQPLFEHFQPWLPSSVSKNGHYFCCYLLSTQNPHHSAVPRSYLAILLLSLFVLLHFFHSPSSLVVSTGTSVFASCLSSYSSIKLTNHSDVYTSTYLMSTAPPSVAAINIHPRHGIKVDSYNKGFKIVCIRMLVSVKIQGVKF